jgi:hypothetical protein
LGFFFWFWFWVFAYRGKERKKPKNQKKKTSFCSLLLGCCFFFVWFLMSEAVAHMLFPFAFLDHHP